MNKTVFSLSVFAWLAITTFCYASPLEVEISLKESVPEEKHKSSTADFFVTTRITNRSNVDQEFWVMNCQYGSDWKSSTSAIITRTKKCRKNNPVKIILKPKDFYTRDLGLEFDFNIQNSGRLNFELGFRHVLIRIVKGEKGKLVNPIRTEVLGVIWSNSIMVNVEKRENEGG